MHCESEDEYRMMPEKKKRNKRVVKAASFCQAIIFLLLMTACGATVEVIQRGKQTKSSYTLTLLPDSTFTYRYRFGPKYEYSRGKWRTDEGRVIVLQSDLKKRTLSLNVKEKSTDSDSIVLSVNFGMPKETQSIYTCSTFINGSLRDMRTCASSIDISVFQKVDSLYFAITADRRIPNRFLDTLFTDSFYPNASLGTNLSVEVNYQDALFNYRTFNRQKFKMPKRGLDSLPVTLKLNNPSEWKGSSLFKSSRESGDHELKVLCVYSEDDTPVKNQKVGLYKDGRRFAKARTGDNGECLIGALPSGIYTLRIARRGYVETDYKIDLLLEKSKYIKHNMVTLDRATLH